MLFGYIQVPNQPELNWTNYLTQSLAHTEGIFTKAEVPAVTTLHGEELKSQVENINLVPCPKAAQCVADVMQFMEPGERRHLSQSTWTINLDKLSDTIPCLAAVEGERVSKWRHTRAME